MSFRSQEVLRKETLYIGFGINHPAEISFSEVGMGNIAADLSNGSENGNGHANGNGHVNGNGNGSDSHSEHSAFELIAHKNLSVIGVCLFICEFKFF